MSKFEPIGLGDRAKDPISGFGGIVTSITHWLHGCIRLGVTPEMLDKDGKPKDERYFDQSQLRLVKRGVHIPMVLEVAAVPEAPSKRASGGPAREAPGFGRG